MPTDRDLINIIYAGDRSTQACSYHILDYTPQSSCMYVCYAYMYICECVSKYMFAPGSLNIVCFPWLTGDITHQNLCVFVAVS